VAGTDIHVAAQRLGRRDRAETHGSRPDHRHFLSRLQATANARVHGDRERFDQTCTRELDRGGQWDQATSLDAELLRHAAIPPDSVDRVNHLRTLLRLARATPVALAAAREGLDRHGRSIIEEARDLVTEDVR
jgi:hypothetical protein